MRGSDLIYAAAGGGLLLASAAFAHRGRKAGRTACIRCEYPLVDPNAAVCPQCGEDPHRAPTARTGEWDMGLSLRRRRINSHAMLLFACGLLAGVLLLVGLLLPRTFRESKPLEFLPQSNQYRMTLAAEITYRQNGLGGAQDYVGSKVVVSVGREGKVMSFTYVPERPNDGFWFRSRHDDKEINRTLEGREVLSWLSKEVDVDLRDPRVLTEVRSEANKLADVVTAFKTPVMVFRDTNAALKSADPEFRIDQTPPMTVEASSLAPAYYPLIAVVPYLAGVIWLELWYARARRRYAPKPKRQRSADAPSAARTLSIIFTDMVKYTEKVDRLPPDDILELIREYRVLVAAAVGARSGFIVKNQGDAFLVTFDSGTDAVLASLDLLRGVRLRNVTVPEAKQFELRIGISTGEVAEEDGDVFGPPVNIASRVQHEAGTGEVLFTEATARAMNHNEVRFERRGEFVLKGVPDPVVVYVALEPERAGRVRMKADG